MILPFLFKVTMRIFLLGFMGSGKSYIGQQLATQLKVQHIDLDDYLEAKAGQSIRSIFEEHGEVYFRKLEQTCLHEMLQYKDVVISTGGGTPCFFDNIDWIKENGQSIYLKTEASLLVERLQSETDKRPLLANKDAVTLQQFIVDKIRQRAAYYEQATKIIEVNTSNQKQLTYQILNALS